jgi:hypothetical protein
MAFLGPEFPVPSDALIDMYFLLVDGVGINWHLQLQMNELQFLRSLNINKNAPMLGPSVFISVVVSDVLCLMRCFGSIVGAGLIR